MTGAGRDALEAARIVVDSGAVYTRTSGDPFFLSSGWASPVFIDVKRLISFPEARQRLLELALRRIDEEFGSQGLDQIAGCELAGVPFAAMVADRLSLPLVVALKQARGFGRLSQFEGTFEPGARTLLFDDLSTDGHTKATFRAALERAEARIAGIFVLLGYNVFPDPPEITSLMTLADIVAVAERDGKLDPGALREVQDFSANAPDWSRRNGGIAKL
ncbi:MAG TPA: orotate phosphoribosyltransferase [Rhizobiales bacterium]|nr:orotate phosphoribosyltransferase [Hyphomicrobiales bacterium]